MVDRSKPLPTSLQNEFIPEEVLLSLTSAANAGPSPENLLPPKNLDQNIERLGHMFSPQLYGRMTDK